jgi:hypothetical protein
VSLPASITALIAPSPPWSLSPSSHQPPTEQWHLPTRQDTPCSYSIHNCISPLPTKLQSSHPSPLTTYELASAQRKHDSEHPATGPPGTCALLQPLSRIFVPSPQTKPPDEPGRDFVSQPTSFLAFKSSSKHPIFYRGAILPAGPARRRHRYQTLTETAREEREIQIQTYGLGCSRHATDPTTTKTTRKL